MGIVPKFNNNQMSAELIITTILIQLGLCVLAYSLGALESAIVEAANRKKRDIGTYNYVPTVSSIFTVALALGLLEFSLYAITK